MRCTFHDDKNASAAVNYDENRFKCHGCGVAGDTYDLIQHVQGGTLVEAIEFAQAVLDSSRKPVFKSHRIGRGVPSNTGSLGRRSRTVPSGSGRRSTSRT